MGADQLQAAGGTLPAACRPGGATAAWRERRDRPLYHVELWPNRSLSPGGKRSVMAIAAAGFAMPLIGTLGTPVFWGLLPFAGGALALLWLGFRRSDADGRLREVLTLWPDEMRVERFEPRGEIKRWRAEPFWVRLMLHEEARIEQYLTLKGGGREIELGAFLSPEERVRLKAEIEAALTRAITGRALS